MRLIAHERYWVRHPDRADQLKHIDQIVGTDYSYKELETAG